MKNKIAHLLMTIVRIVVIVLSIFCICFFILISPYDEWNIVDYDMVDAEKIVLLSLSILNILFSLLSKKAHKAYLMIFVIITIVCIIRFSWLLTLQCYLYHLVSIPKLGTFVSSFFNTQKLHLCGSVFCHTISRAIVVQHLENRDCCDYGYPPNLSIVSEMFLRLFLLL